MPTTQPENRSLADAVRRALAEEHGAAADPLPGRPMTGAEADRPDGKPAPGRSSGPLRAQRAAPCRAPRRRGG
ncbi:MAG TPA: hypothetical protein VGH99_23765 [Pseudonocardia sp.]